MAERKQLWHPEAKCYVYRIFDGMETVYVGKGSGYRLNSQKRKFGLSGEIIEHCESDDVAFQREIHWIAALRPTANKLLGGNGGRTAPKPISKEMMKANKEYAKFERDYETVGPRRYVARFLLTILSESNAPKFGLSTVDLFRLREVANGCWC